MALKSRDEDLRVLSQMKKLLIEHFGHDPVSPEEVQGLKRLFDWQ